MKAYRTFLRGFALVTLSLIVALPSVGALNGPSSTPPGGGSLADSGSNGNGEQGRAGGRTFTWTGMNPASYPSYWGVTSISATYYTGSALSYSAVDSNLAGGIVVFNSPGITNAYYNGCYSNCSATWSSQTVYVRAVVTVTDLGGTPLALVTSLSVGAPAAVGAVLPVSGSFKANVAFFTSTSATGPFTTPSITYRDGFGWNGYNSATTSLTAGFYYPPTATVSGSATICSGGSANVVASLIGTPPFAITWSDGLVQTGVNVSPATRVVSPTMTTTYAITALSDAKGAATTFPGSATITFDPSCVAVTAPSSVCPGGSGNIASVADAGAGATYSWSITNGTITGGQGTSSITFTAGLTGSVVVGATVVPSGGGSLSGVTSIPTSKAGEGLWTWKGGSNYPSQYGSYGVLGNPSAGNSPGARQYPVSWKDTSGGLWLFGGYGSAASAVGDLNDLWRFDTANGLWTWVNGSNLVNQNGIYGTPGVPAPANAPGARYGSVSWTDGSGRFWLFGGTGYAVSTSGSLNDLWRYDVSTGMWTWMKGANGSGQYGIYGTPGTPAAANTPGARIFSTSWTDASGNLWLFGGNGYGASSAGLLNDLWKYDVASGMWAWMGGSSAPSQNGTYGTLGTPAAGNVPGARQGSVTWVDGSGNLWLFGGFGYSASGSGQLNDLWNYDISTGLWTWMKGSNSQNQAGSYGVLGTPGASNAPGSREGALTWKDAAGNLWLFGGNGYAATGVGNLNDLWEFDVASGLWTWMKGSNSANQVGTYGILGNPAAGNLPGGRCYSAAWNGAGGDSWIFGGSGIAAAGNGTGTLSDLWLLAPHCTSITIAPPSLPGGFNGLPYSQTLSAANGAGGYVFSLLTGTLPTGLSLSPAGVLSGTPTTNGPFRFTVMVTDAGGATAIRTYNVAIASCPAITGSITGTTAICAGGSAIVTVTVGGGVAPHTVSLDNGGGTQTGTGPAFTFTVSPGATTTYSVQSLADTNGCSGSGSGSATVTVNAPPAKPVITPAGATTICSGTSVTLNSSAGSGYLWSTGATTSSITASASGSYWVIVTDANGCASPQSDPVSVTVKPTPGTPVASSDTPVCEGAPLHLTSASVTGASYWWTGPDGFTSATQNPTLASTTAASAGTYSVTVTVDGCASSPGATSVTVSPDTTAPTVTAPAPVSLDQSACCGTFGGATPSSSAALSTFVAGGTATDDCAPSPTRLTAQVSGADIAGSTCFEAGATTVTFRFRDTAGKVGTATAAATVRMFGDLNLDQTVDPSDMVILRAYANFVVTPGTPPFAAPLGSADLNHDAIVDAADLVYLRGYLNLVVPCLAP